jgi:hypothetical protein
MAKERLKCAITETKVMPLLAKLGQIRPKNGSQQFDEE